MDGKAMQELPRYQCHKKVWALKIAKVEYEIACCEACTVNGQNIVCGRPQREHTPEAARGDVGMDHDFIPGTWNVPGAHITPADEGYSAFDVDEEYFRKHLMKLLTRQVVGGYYVVYDDGYKSFSPAAAFENGYVRI